MPRFSCAGMIAALAFVAVSFFPSTAMRAEDLPLPTLRALPGWTALPGGSRSVFIGIHGGTSAVTLLPSNSGGLLAVPGLTGRDFQRLISSFSDTAQVKAPQPDLNTPSPTHSIAFWLRLMLHTQPDIELFAEDTLEQAPRNSSPFMPSLFPIMLRLDDDDA